MKDRKTLEQEFLDILQVLHALTAPAPDPEEARPAWRASHLVEEVQTYETRIPPDFPLVELQRPLGNFFLRAECVEALRGELLRVYLRIATRRDRDDAAVLRRGFVFVSKDNPVPLDTGETGFIAECAIPARSERSGDLPRNTYPLQVKILCIEPVRLKWVDAERFLQAWQEADFKPSDEELAQWLKAKLQDDALRRAKKTREAWQRVLETIKPR